MLKYALAAGMFGLLVLAIAPQLDLACARLFYAGHGHFVGATSAGVVARDVARLVPLLLFTAPLLLYIGRRIGLVTASCAPSGRSMIFLALSLGLGPGLLVTGLKDEMHRPRPVQIRRFGGERAFVPFYSASGGCPRNCSFPSGEAAAAFWTLAPASLAPLPLRLILSVLGLAFGLAAGFLRMAFGGHFLSDVVAAGLFTLALIAGLRRLLLPQSHPLDQPKGSNAPKA